jgi:hypothetical protein
MPSFDPISGAPLSGGEEAASGAGSGGTSGTSSFNATRNQIIRQAALHIGAIGADRIMNATMLSDFAYNLNGMIKRWQAKGIHVWTVSEATLFPVAGQVKYGAGGIADDHITQVYVETEASAGAAAGATVISVDDATAFALGDNVGITLDSGALHWSTITLLTATTITFALALTDSVSSTARVYGYTARIVRPLKIVNARRYDVEAATDTPIGVIARQSYRDLSLKTGAGSINQIFYDPQLSTGYIYLWRAPAAPTELLKFTWHRPLQDFNDAGNNPDMPQEWIQTIEFNLAVTMAPQFDVPPGKFAQVASLAATYLDDLMGFDRENESVMFAPDMEGSGY